ncbi:uncharacterized protein PG986_011617 [Apiospora aurea]|uniref:Ribosomal protein L9 domain-containing protein n=1 Tax=Apiospora aurea TaxID=335848 RepID=A0ABR1PY06_9PEZI
MAFRIQPLARPAARATAFAAGCSSSSTSTSTAATCRSPLLSSLFQSQQQLLHQHQQQVRYARTMTKAEEEDLQGIPVRLLRDIVGFGRRHAIIRVKPGRMRNVWHHKGLAEYMTKQRFQELGVTEAAIGVRDRTFGTQMLIEDESAETAAASKPGSGSGSSQSKRNNAMLEGTRTQSVRQPAHLTPFQPPEETRAIFDQIIPEVLTFARKPISTPEPAEPAIPRSPALAANAVTSASSGQPEPSTTAAAVTAIFGSVTAHDILEIAIAGAQSVRPGAVSSGALQARDIVILGLEAGEDRIKRLGRFEVEIRAGGDGVPPLRRVIEVVPEGEA